MNCRFCKHIVEEVFIDLVNSPASNSFLSAEQLAEPEVFYPLKVMVCTNCFLVQVDEFKKSSAIFNSEYVYFSSYSQSWLKHAKAYTEMAINRFKLHDKSLVVEVASNDGYLLQYFKEKNIPVLGIEPTKNTAAVAEQKGIRTLVDFFGVALGKALSEKGEMADLVLGNNVLAHVPDILDFVGGMKLILKPEGVITLEFPHLLNLIKYNQFDTIYHEHFSYLSFSVVNNIFSTLGLDIFDVEELSTHGGSLRIFATHSERQIDILPTVSEMLRAEKEIGVSEISYYKGFQERAFKVKSDFIQFLLDQKRSNKKVVGYGAAAKGNTLLNYCGIKNDLIDYVVDANPAKQGKYLPASHIPVVEESFLKETKPDFIVLFPWNLKDELVDQLSYVRSWGGKFVIPIPEVSILS